MPEMPNKDANAQGPVVGLRLPFRQGLFPTKRHVTALGRKVRIATEPSKKKKKQG